MGINNLAVQTFSSSGSQSVSRANKADSSKQISSDFISRPSVKYINGSGISVVNGTLTKLPYGTKPSETFSIPNNIDAISEMILNMDLNISTITTGYACSGIYYSKTFLLDIINNIEIKLSGLVIQTIYPGDIYMRNYSESGNLISQENSFKKIIDASYVDTGSIIGHGLTPPTTPTSETISFSLSIPFIGKSSDKDRSFLQTGSFTKNLTVTVNYNTFSSSEVTGGSFIPLLHTLGATTTNTNTNVSTKLCILTHIITDTEKNFIKQNIIHRVINTSTGIRVNQITNNYIKEAAGITSINVDLDNIDLNVTHIMFCLNVNIFNQSDKTTDSLVAPTQFLNSTDSTSASVTPAVLKAQSAYVSGDTKLSSTWGEAGIDSNKGTSTIFNPDVLGVFDKWLSSAELVLGNETTGEIPCSALSSNQVEFNLQNTEQHFYIIKLADKAFSGSGIPFSRIKNKKLILNVRNTFFNTTAITITPVSGDNTVAIGSTSLAATTTIGKYVARQMRDATISVCACGTTLQIINNNTISFSYI